MWPAYRLIARDTVEACVLELQRQKRGLADAILNADSRLLRDLRREDLELLLRAPHRPDSMVERPGHR
jgi:SNF2 family DNA or RNA helicase